MSPEMIFVAAVLSALAIALAAGIRRIVAENNERSAKDRSLQERFAASLDVDDPLAAYAVQPEAPAPKPDGRFWRPAIGDFVVLTEPFYNLPVGSKGYVYDIESHWITADVKFEDGPPFLGVPLKSLAPKVQDYL